MIEEDKVILTTTVHHGNAVPADVNYRGDYGQMLKQYLLNLWLWLRGWWHLKEIEYKPGWSATDPRWWVIYALDYGLACLLGRGVQSMSRAFTMFGKSHWKMTGGLLWGSKDLWR